MSCPGPGWTQATDGTCTCYGVLASDGVTCTDSQPVVNGIVQPMPQTAVPAIATPSAVPTGTTACSGLFQSSTPGSGLGVCYGPLDLGSWILIAGALWLFNRKGK